MCKINKSNLFESLPESHQELFQTVLKNEHVKIERIVSRGHCSPEGFWYDQAWDEWVLLLRGSAGLIVDGCPEVMVLAPGDCLLIPSGVKHRVAWTDKHGATVWLAVHLGGGKHAAGG